GGREHGGEAVEAAQGDFRQQGFGVAEVAIGGRGTDAGQPRRLGDGEAGGAFLGDQRCRGLDQRLAQVAVVIAAPFESALPCPTHVKELYIRRRLVPS